MSTEDANPQDSLERVVRARREISVWDRLAKAYKRKGGLRLSPSDVDYLMLSDVAARDAARHTYEEAP